MFKTFVFAVGLLGMFKTFVWYCSRASARPLYGIAVGLLGMFKTFVWYCSRASCYV